MKWCLNQHINESWLHCYLDSPFSSAKESSSTCLLWQSPSPGTRMASRNRISKHNSPAVHYPETSPLSSGSPLLQGGLLWGPIMWPELLVPSFSHPIGAPVQAPHWCTCFPSLVFTSYKLVFMSYHLKGAVKSWQPLQISILPLVHGGGSSHLWQWFLPCEVDGCTVLKSCWSSKVICQHSTQAKLAHCCSEGERINMPLRSGGI